MEKVVFVGDMENGSKSSSQRQRKSARDCERETSQTFNIGTLWQRGQNTGLISGATNSQIRPGEPSQYLPLFFYPIVLEVDHPSYQNKRRIKFSE